MISEKSKKWVEAGKIFSTDKNSKFLCPECNDSFLLVEDTLFKNKIERKIYCPKCKAKNFLLLKN